MVSYIKFNGNRLISPKSIAGFNKEYLISSLGVFFTLVAVIGVNSIPLDNPFMDAVIVFTEFVWGVTATLVGIRVLSVSAVRPRIIRALAGLELGVFHCEDELVILLSLSRKYASAVINGVYDSLLTTPEVCQTIGNKPVIVPSDTDEQ